MPSPLEQFAPWSNSNLLPMNGDASLQHMWVYSKYSLCQLYGFRCVNDFFCWCWLFVGGNTISVILAQIVDYTSCGDFFMPILFFLFPTWLDCKISYLSFYFTFLPNSIPVIQLFYSNYKCTWLWKPWLCCVYTSLLCTHTCNLCTKLPEILLARDSCWCCHWCNYPIRGDWDRIARFLKALLLTIP